MMKLYNMDAPDYKCTLIVGTDREIRSLYKNLEKHGFAPLFWGSPIFRTNSMYGIVLEHSTNYTYYHVVDANTVVRMLVGAD